MLLAMVACNIDKVITDEAECPEISFDNPSGVYSLKVGERLTLTPSVRNAEEALYTWLLEGEVVGSEPAYTFHAKEEGRFYLLFRVEARGGKAEQEVRLDVHAPKRPTIAFLTDGEGAISVAANTPTRIAPAIGNDTNARYRWTLNDEQVGSERTYLFCQSEVGDYTLTLQVHNDEGEASATLTVRVVKRLAAKLYLPTPSHPEGCPATAISLGQSLHLCPFTEQMSDPDFEWNIGGQVCGTERVFCYTPTQEGIETLLCQATDTNGESLAATIEVRCCAPEASHLRPITSASSPHATRVLAYTPAPGQFINEGGLQASTPEEATTLAEKILRENTSQGNARYLSLGAWGGALVVGFDHSVRNGAGADFSITGNHFNESSEPGVVYLMQDSNENGLADEVWYEVRGSESGKTTTLSDYAITYHRPQGARQSVLWRDNRGQMGEIPVNAYHKQESYYPAWIEAERYTLYGTRLPAKTYQDASGNYINEAYAWGYADNAGSDAAPESDAENRGKVYFDISNAQHADGTPVSLQYIDFVRVQSAIYHIAPIIGENSTEIFALTDEQY